MAIAVDANLGSFGNDAALTSIGLTTSASASSNSFITVFVTWFTTSAVTLSNVSGGSLTWTIDKQSTSSQGRCAIVSAQAASGLASSTTLTANFSAATVGGVQIAATSWTGVATSTPVDGTPPTDSNGGTTTWTTPSYTVGNAGSVLVGLAYNFNTGVTSTPTSPAIEIQDWESSSTGSGATATYRLPGSTGAFTLSGTWSTSASGSADTLAVAYLPGAGGGPTLPPDLIMAPPHR